VLGQDWQAYGQRTLPLLNYAGLKNMDRFGWRGRLPEAAAELAHYTPGFELGLGVFAGARSQACARLASFCETGVFLPLYGTRK
jgi:hypothetical protein